MKKSSFGTIRNFTREVKGILTILGKQNCKYRVMTKFKINDKSLGIYTCILYIINYNTKLIDKKPYCAYILLIVICMYKLL